LPLKSRLCRMWDDPEKQSCMTARRNSRLNIVPGTINRTQDEKRCYAARALLVCFITTTTYWLYLTYVAIGTVRETWNQSCRLIFLDGGIPFSIYHLFW
jgi:hypothetical protein